jgi:hypothetical protein
VHYQGLQVVEAKGTGENAGQMVVMNRTGSLVVQDNKGRDRERYPIVTSDFKPAQHFCDIEGVT